MAQQTPFDINSLIQTCVTGFWESKNLQETWLNKRLTDMGLGVEAFDDGAQAWALDNHAAQDWSDRANGPTPRSFGAYLRGA